MPLTVHQTAYLDSKLGPGTWEAATLDTAITRIAGRTGVDVTVATAYAAREVLEGRLAAFRADPASFSIPGEYQQDTSANIRALTDAVASIPAPPDGGDVGNPIRVVVPDRSRWAR